MRAGGRAWVSRAMLIDSSTLSARERLTRGGGYLLPPLPATPLPPSAASGGLRAAPAPACTRERRPRSPLRFSETPSVVRLAEAVRDLRLAAAADSAAARSSSSGLNAAPCGFCAKRGAGRGASPRPASSPPLRRASREAKAGAAAAACFAYSATGRPGTAAAAPRPPSPVQRRGRGRASGARRGRSRRRSADQPSSSRRAAATTASTSAATRSTAHTRIDSSASSARSRTWLSRPAKTRSTRRRARGSLSGPATSGAPHACSPDSFASSHASVS